MEYSEALEFIDSSFVSFQTAGKRAYREGLEAIRSVCAYLDNPQDDYLTIHIAGTNGKGSVAHSLASVLQEAGYRTGLYTSPHLRDFRERIRVDGTMVPEQAVADFVERHGKKMTELGLSYFEMTTAMAFRHFADSDVEVAVIETGLGGRLDATNIIKPCLTVITNVGLDHTDILGDTIAEIATEKAGIIKRGVPVVIGESDAEASAVFEDRVAEMKAPLFYAPRLYSAQKLSDHPNEYSVRRLADGREQHIVFGLGGSCQVHNLVTVRSAVSVLRRHSPLAISMRAMNEGLRKVVVNTGLQGRWQKLSEGPLVICDTGHNEHAMKYIAHQLEELPCEKLYMVIGFAADKSIDRILEILPRKAYYLFTMARSPRALTAGKLAEMAAAYGLAGEVSGSVPAAYARAKELADPDDAIFIGGSSYIVAEIIPTTY